ncbi:alpha/beta fold hydrolase [Aspergillus aculeatinus CBS 121060]|uniref:Alpha/beta-hydrolase n=1 Tax=Aspergillus aculeatinus CBS 121060 TaxID=1448322 RepID=A0ACD1H7Z0_9EURO|nr:alpha/beta-hydrolase [Aspergillus aculeatinus CBS 121060]RAH69768.1 alpha/beta-hydrolase [Aspergillus aculeatinus CBS 121060]
MTTPWNKGTHSALVPLPERGPSLFLSAAGPERQKRNGSLPPAVIIEAGLGSSHVEWVAVQRLIAARARVYTYDRAGYGRSSEPPSPLLLLPPTAHNRVRELTQLLDAAQIPPPYVLIGHSYGGVLVREFLRQRGPDVVVGMVIVDSPRAQTPLPADWPSLMGDSDYYAVVGLDENVAVAPEEYRAIKEDEVRNRATAEAELALIAASTKELNEAIPEGVQALGNGRLSVIFANESVDFGKVYAYGVEHGHGSEEARRRLAERLAVMEEMDERGQRAHLSLSSRSRFVYATGKARTHNLQLVAPEVIRDEVFWVLGLVD